MTVPRWIRLCGVVCALGMSNGLHAQVVQQYEYQRNGIYPIHTGLGITTQIELSPDDKVLDFSTGFSSGWELSRRENVFYLKPKNVDVDTNMMVRTETRSYIFELKVVATDWKTLDEARREGVEYMVTFKYPEDGNSLKGSRTKADSSGLSTTLVPTRSYNFNYDYSTVTKGAPWLVPVNVYDDGRFTYIKLNDMPKFPSGDFPAVFMRESEKGEDSLVNTSVEGNMIIVHGTYPYLVVRHGDKVVELRRNTTK